MTSREVDAITRRELLERTARLALGAGVMPLAGRLAGLAGTAPPGIYGQLARTLQGEVVVPSDPGYTQARVLFDTRFDGVHPHAVVLCESLTDVERTVRWARKHALRI